MFGAKSTKFGCKASLSSLLIAALGCNAATVQTPSGDADGFSTINGRSFYNAVHSAVMELAEDRAETIQGLICGWYDLNDPFSSPAFCTSTPSLDIQEYYEAAKQKASILRGNTTQLPEVEYWGSALADVLMFGYPEYAGTFPHQRNLVTSLQKLANFSDEDAATLDELNVGYVERPDFNTLRSQLHELKSSAQSLLDILPPQADGPVGTTTLLMYVRPHFDGTEEPEEADRLWKDSVDQLVSMIPQVNAAMQSIHEEILGVAESIELKGHFGFLYRRVRQMPKSVTEDNYAVGECTLDSLSDPFGAIARRETFADLILDHGYGEVQRDLLSGLNIMLLDNFCARTNLETAKGFNTFAAQLGPEAVGDYTESAFAGLLLSYPGVVDIARRNFELIERECTAITGWEQRLCYQRSDESIRQEVFNRLAAEAVQAYAQRAEVASDIKRAWDVGNAAVGMGLLLYGAAAGAGFALVKLTDDALGVGAKLLTATRWTQKGVLRVGKFAAAGQLVNVGFGIGRLHQARVGAILRGDQGEYYRQQVGTQFLWDAAFLGVDVVGVRVVERLLPAVIKRFLPRYLARDADGLIHVVMADEGWAGPRKSWIDELEVVDTFVDGEYPAKMYQLSDEFVSGGTPTTTRFVYQADESARFVQTLGDLQTGGRGLADGSGHASSAANLVSRIKALLQGDDVTVLLVDNLSQQSAYVQNIEGNLVVFVGAEGQGYSNIADLSQGLTKAQLIAAAKALYESNFSTVFPSLGELMNSPQEVAKVLGIHFPADWVDNGLLGNWLSFGE